METTRTTTSAAGHQPADATAIHARMFAAALALAAGAKAGLPAPFNVTCTETEVKLGFTTHAELVDWATWVDEPIGTHDDRSGVLQHNVVAELMCSRFNLWAIEVVDEAAA